MLAAQMTRFIRYLPLSSSSLKSKKYLTLILGLNFSSLY